MNPSIQCGLVVLLLSCSSGSVPTTAPTDEPEDVLAGESTVPVGHLAGGYAWFSERQSVRCAETTNVRSALTLVISDQDGCGTITNHPCDTFKDVTMVLISLRNEGPADMPVKPRTYTLSSISSVTGHNEYAISISTMEADENGIITDDDGLAPTGVSAWSGSVTLSEVTDDIVSGSLDLTDPTGTPYLGEFTALKCQAQQALQGPRCLGDPPSPETKCPE
jgi:hypothetical protein